MEKFIRHRIGDERLVRLILKWLNAGVMEDERADMVKWLQSVVRGYFRYHAVPRNEYRLRTFRHEVRRMWLWHLRGRSQRTRRTWDKFLEKLGNLLPEVEVLHPHPMPDVRFASDHPNWGGYIRGKSAG